MYVGVRFVNELVARVFSVPLVKSPALQAAVG